MNTQGKFSLFIIVFLCAPLFFCSDGRDQAKINKEPLIGVKIYEYEGNFEELFSEWVRLKIDTAFVSESLLANRQFRDLAKKHSITLFVILPIFYNPEALKKNPEFYAITDEGERAKEEWVEFICPTSVEYSDHRIADIQRIVSEFDPDGISLDFIRHFVFWEKVYPDRTLNSIPNTCFDSRCMNTFANETGIVIPPELTDTQQKADWIKTQVLDEWVEWKCSVITRTVQAIKEAAKAVKPDLLINVHAVPWRAEDFEGAVRIVAGQDLGAISEHTDIISPMCYSHMVNRPPPWIHSIVIDMHSRTKSRIIPSIQVKEAYLTDIFSVGEFEEALGEALKPPSGGVIFWSWDALDKDPEKKQVIKKLLK
ncbi:MAG: hypothetical protein PVH84_10020 [Candidatus Aminicenantes bacterium]|jgi:hypothetical protein